MSSKLFLLSVLMVLGNSLANANELFFDNEQIVEGGILGDNIVLSPPEGKEGDAQALVFIIGAECGQDKYNDLLTAIQNKVSFPLWVSIPHIVGEAIPPTISTYVGNSINELKSTYGFESEKYFFGGHSLGGAGIASYAKDNDKALGSFLLGSYVGLSVEDPAANFGSPVMTVGAEFDGWMARITRIAESYDQMKSSSVGFDTSRYTHPVVLIPGISHASFLTGVPPSTVQQTDLRATVSNTQAIESVSNAVSAFFEVTANGQQTQQAKNTIDDLLEVTATYLEPILDIWRMEGDPNLSTFQTSSPWIPIAQSRVAQSEEHNDLTFDFEDEYKTFVAVEGEFAHAKPNITTSDQGEIRVQSFSHSAYNWRTISEIDAADYYAAYEIGAKMKSREAIFDFAGMDFTNTEEATCREINEYATQWVLENFQDNHNQIARFQQDGQPIEYLDDVSSGSGITWCNEGIITKNTTESFQVQSRVLVSPIDFMVPVAAGMIYCKLMSPARILEWMLVDGLKMNHYWVPAPTDEAEIYVQ